MPIKTVEEFYCPLCDYISRNPHALERIKKTGICPACHNGKPMVWSDTKEEKK